MATSDSQKVPDEVAKRIVEEYMSPEAALDRAIARAGTVVELAKRIGMTRHIIHRWVRMGGGVPEKHVDAVCEAVDLQPGEVRPDLAKHYLALHKKFSVSEK